MNRKLIVLAMAAGFAAGAWAQTSVTLVVDGVPDSRNLVLDSLNAAGGSMTVSVSTDGGGGGGGGEPVLLTRTLTVTTPVNGRIVNNANQQPVSGVLDFQYMSDATAPTISLSLQADTGFDPSSWGGSCSSVGATTNCVLSMSSNRTVSAVFAAEPAAGDCPAPGSNVTVVQTTASAARYGRETVANSATSRDRVFAYRFTTLAGGSIGRAVATRLTGGEGKYVVITKCPGDVTNPIASRGCAASSSESTSVYYAVKPTSKDWRLYCHVDPATTYYVNVVNGGATTPGNCTTNCGYYMELE